MNPSFTQYIYQQYQPDEYYRSYLKQAKHRADNRLVNQHRPIKINISHNSVILNIGETTVISSLKMKFQPVIYNELTNSYGQDLISLNVRPFNTSGNPNKYQRNASKAIQQFVRNYLLGQQKHSILSGVQKKLVRELQHQNKMKQLYAFILNIDFVIASNAGGVSEACLLATQILLWTTKLIVPQKYCPMIQNQTQISKMLEITKFVFPIRYCQILDQILVDPSESQTHHSNFQITLMANLLSQKISNQIIVIQNSHKGDSPSLFVDSLKSLFLTQLSKLSFNIKQLKEIAVKGSQCQNICIENI